MTEYEIRDGMLQLTVEGFDRLWALRSHLTIPLQDIIEVHADANPRADIQGGARRGGTDVPGILRAGTFHNSNGWLFWDVGHPGKAIVISLQHEHYQQLVVAVEDPEAAVNEITAALP